MSKPRPEDTLRQWFEEVWNARRLELAEELLAPDAVLHDASVAGGALRGPAEFQQHARALLTAIPNLRFTVEHVVASDDGVAARLLVTGNLAGSGLGVEPANQPIRIHGMTIGRFRDGRLVEAWNNFDMLGLFDQLDALKRPRLRLDEE